MLATHWNGRDWGAASKSARLKCTDKFMLTYFRLTAGRFRGNSCIVVLWVACELLQFAAISRPAWLELFVDHTHTHSMKNLRWQPHWLPRLTSLPRKSRDWWRTRDSLGQRTENKNFFCLFPFFYLIKSQISDSFVNHFDGHLAYLLKTLDFSFNSTETVRLIRDGEKEGGRGMEGGGGGGREIYLSLHCHRQNDSCGIKMGSNMAAILMFQY